MKRFTSLTLFMAVLMSVQFVVANTPDSAYVLSYATDKNYNKNGMHYAWSIDQANWNSIGPEHRFLSSDFGSWGPQKRMLSPFLFKDQEGLFHCVWTLNEKTGQFAHTTTTDLHNWKPQEYPTLMLVGNVLLPEVSYNEKEAVYEVTWVNDLNGEQKFYKSTTKDFNEYTPAVEISEKERLDYRITTKVNGEEVVGTVQKLSWTMIDALMKYQEWMDFHNQERAETMSQDPERFKRLEKVETQINLAPAQSKAISDLLIGVFFEDINYAADGGIYAELVQNRGFEYQISDRQGRDSSWHAKKAWSITGKGIGFAIDTVDPIHQNNKNYALLNVSEKGAGLTNEGFDGIAVKKGDNYKFSVFAKQIDESNGALEVQLVNEEGKVIGKTSIKALTAKWQNHKSVITVKEDCDKAKIVIVPKQTGKLALDMISLFPEKTFKGRENGLRTDLAQTIADLKPAFVRFPGGCVAHGNGLANMYRWKNTIGPLESRKPQRNIWNYHQSAGLGYYEYFQYCEDIGAEPLPVVPAGVPCQNSSEGGDGQQGGIPMCDMEDYVQEVLDLIEWANGDKNSKWGKLRAQAGHPEPFNLKYIGVGNEDLITDIFEERFEMIFKAVQEKYPDIVVIGTVGPFYMGSDYEEGWDFATKLGVPMVDEHYYQPPGWFINNQDFYDMYSREEPKVYLGEYAAHVRGRHMNIETALSEALYLTSVERNGDVVSMTSFAPLLAKEGNTQWTPDLIYFNNTEVKPTVDYYVQKLYGNNVGDEYIPGEIKLSNNRKEVVRRIAYSVVKDSETNDLIIKLANLLPVEVETKINLDEFVNDVVNAKLWVLSGTPDDRNAKPVESTIDVSKDWDYNMPAYSFSVVRFKMK